MKQGIEYPQTLKGNGPVPVLPDVRPTHQAMRRPILPLQHPHAVVDYMVFFGLNIPGH